MREVTAYIKAYYKIMTIVNEDTAVKFLTNVLLDKPSGYLNSLTSRGYIYISTSFKWIYTEEGYSFWRDLDEKFPVIEIL